MFSELRIIIDNQAERPNRPAAIPLSASKFSLFHAKIRPLTLNQAKK
jgi:hypothetical protein